MGKTIDVKKLSEIKKENLKKEIKMLSKKNVIPKLAVIIASFDESSKIYVRNKKRLCDSLGILQEEYYFSNTVTTDDILDTIDKLNKDDSVHGILVQLPLYKHLDKHKILESIDVRKDVDGFKEINTGRLLLKSKDMIIPCTAKGIMSILEFIKADISGKYAVIVGRSQIVGKPISYMLLNNDATVTICHSKTKNLGKYTKDADILVVVAGVCNLIKKDMVKKGSIVIDVGINKVDGKIYGDVNLHEVIDDVEYITKVPGGVGVMTVISLIENLIELVKRSNNIK